MSPIKTLPLRIACDGESASGKSLGAKLISKKYKLNLLNSGLLYRYATFLIFVLIPVISERIIDDIQILWSPLVFTKIDLF